jgi:pilus assembly protein TadC
MARGTPRDFLLGLIIGTIAVVLICLLFVALVVLQIVLGKVIGTLTLVAAVGACVAVAGFALARRRGGVRRLADSD